MRSERQSCTGPCPLVRNVLHYTCMEGVGISGHRGVIIALLALLASSCYVRHPDDPEVDYYYGRYLIFVSNKCRSSAQLGVRYLKLDDRWEDDEWWTIPARTETYLRLKGTTRRIRTVDDRVYFHVQGYNGGNEGFLYGGQRRWMVRAKFDEGDIVIDVPCNRSGTRSGGRRPGRGSPNVRRAQPRNRPLL